ncbi:RNA polymerase sigma-70 factor [Ravibacter arvi]|uniref:RNA polymerase sigma-70 factor n=1 Tax=Ravibacter arvi TaxID=2051041 RepID=A0ABP8M4K8_9BACT
MVTGAQLEMLFRENYHAMVFFAMRLVDSRIEAEDIVQDAFVKYWDQREAVSADLQAVRSYIYTTIRNASLNSVRHREVARRFADQQIQLVLPSEPTILEHLLEAETMVIVHKAMSMLPPVCRQIARMTHLEGKSNEEIATELGITVNSVKSHKQRAVKFLKQYLDPEMFLLLTPFLD